MSTRVKLRVRNSREQRRPGSSHPAAETQSIRDTPSLRTKISRTFSLHTLSEIFLPSGFPDSVTPDYITYQFYDSLQAFSSAIAGLLSSRAVLEGFGVGNEKASSTNAVLLTVIQDATGRLATILFAWKFGPALAPEAKAYRLAADIFNDSAFILDCLSPALTPTPLRVLALCLAGGFRAVCGVCGGGAKAALSVHFARTSANVGELNAKDASQETVIGLLGMLCGSFVMSHVTSRPATWTTLALLLAIHLWTNYLAVRAITLTTLSRQRTNIAYGIYRSQGGNSNNSNYEDAIGTVPAPSEVARRERIFEFPGAVRDPLVGSILGTCTICTSAEDLLRGSQLDLTNSWRDALEAFRDEVYVLFCVNLKDRPCKVWICFKREAEGPEVYLKAWVNACELCSLVAQRERSPETSLTVENNSDLVRASLHHVNKVFADFSEKAKKAGYDLAVDAICTMPVRTLDIELVDSETKKSR